MLHNKKFCTSLYDCNDAALLTLRHFQRVFNKGHLHVDVAAPGRRETNIPIGNTTLGDGNAHFSAFTLDKQRATVAELHSEPKVDQL